MPWCPLCKQEYRDGFTKCSDCEIELVAELEPEAIPPKRINKIGFRLFISVFAVCVLIIGYKIVFDYYSIYSIPDNKELIGQSIMPYTNRSELISTSSNGLSKIIIEQAIVLDNREFVLYRFEDDFALMYLEKGLNNKYKYNGSEGGYTPFLYGVKETNKSNYFVIFGRNWDMRMSYAKATIDHKEYKLNIPKQEYFIVYCPILKNEQGANPYNSDFKLFDDNNIDITEDIYDDYLQQRI